MYLFAIIVVVIVALFGVIFGAQNSGIMDLQFLGRDFCAPKITVMIVTFGCGVVFAFILAIIDEIRLRGRIGKQQKEIDSLKRELGALKTMPTQEEKE